MGILEAMTLNLFALKLTPYPEWSWLLVASPLLVALAIYSVLIVLFFTGSVALANKNRK